MVPPAPLSFAAREASSHSPQGLFFCALRHAAGRSSLPAALDRSVRIALKLSSLMVFNLSAALPVVVTSEPSPSDRCSALPADAVITIPCRDHSTSDTKERSISWLELLGQR